MDKFLIKGKGKGKSSLKSAITTATTTSITTTTACLTAFTTTNSSTNVTASEIFTSPIASTSRAIPNIPETVISPSSSIPNDLEVNEPEDVLITEPQAKKQKTAYNFNDKWLRNDLYNKWLVKRTSGDEVVAYCKVCDSIIVNHKPALDKHMGTAKHKTNIKTISSCKPIEKLFIPKPEDEQIKRAEIKICAFVAEHNLPISLVDELVPFMANIFPDSTIAKKVTLGRTKATNMITKMIAPIATKELLKIIKVPGNFFSIIMDETTDITIKKQCALSIIFYNEKTDSVQTKFLDMYEVESGKAEDLCQALLDWLDRHSIPNTNFVGFASDTTNSMVGEHNSVFSHLKSNNPDMTCIKCSCHMIHLVASKACLKLPRSVEDMLRNIAAHFSRSSKRQTRLVDFQKFFEIDCHKILSPSNTRWLSLKPCVDRTLQQYEVLKEYFRVEVFEDPSITTQNILETLNSKMVKIYLEFMSYTLELLNDFNKLFQTEKPLLHTLQPEVENLIKTIGSNYLQFNYIKTTPPLNLDYTNPRNFLPLDNIYLGVSATTTIQETESDNPSYKTEITNLKKNCLAFYIEILNQIKQRFDFKDPVFEVIAILDPKEAQSFKIKDLTKVISRYPILKQTLNEQDLHTEWRQHAMLEHEKIGLPQNVDAETYWRAVFNLKNTGQEPLFLNLRKALRLLLILPFSNACVERVFSQLKLIKTDHRNRLNTTTIAALMTTKQYVNNAVHFEPDKSLLNSKIKLY